MAGADCSVDKGEDILKRHSGKKKHNKVFFTLTMSDEDKHVKLITLIISLQRWEAFGPRHSFGFHLTLTTHSKAANDQVHAQTAMSFPRWHWTPQRDSVLRHDTKTAQESAEERRPGLQILKVRIWGIICGICSWILLQNSGCRCFSVTVFSRSRTPTSYLQAWWIWECEPGEQFLLDQMPKLQKHTVHLLLWKMDVWSAVDRRNDDRGSVVKAWSKSARLAIFLISSRCWWEIW